MVIQAQSHLRIQGPRLQDTGAQLAATMDLVVIAEPIADQAVTVEGLHMVDHLTADHRAATDHPALRTRLLPDRLVQHQHHALRVAVCASNNAETI